MQFKLTLDLNNFCLRFLKEVWSWIHTWTQAFFLSLCCLRISVFWGHERLTDRSISKRYLKSDIATWVEKSSTSRTFHLVTQDSIGHLKTLCMSVISLAVAFESDWKCYSSLQSDKKMLAFEYEFSLSFEYSLLPIYSCSAIK